jgi:hypothetical protein
MVDDAGSEVMQMHAQHDHQLVTGKDSRRFIGANDLQKVEEDQVMEVVGQQQTVVGDCATRKSACEHWIVDGLFELSCATFQLTANERNDDVGTWSSRADTHDFVSRVFTIHAEDVVVRCRFD